jgi:hypothetical protein
MSPHPVVPIKHYVGIFLVLIALTVTTVLVSKIELSRSSGNRCRRVLRFSICPGIRRCLTEPCDCVARRTGMLSADRGIQAAHSIKDINFPENTAAKRETASSGLLRRVSQMGRLFQIATSLDK